MADVINFQFYVFLSLVVSPFLLGHQQKLCTLMSARFFFDDFPCQTWVLRGLPLLGSDHSAYESALLGTFHHLSTLLALQK